MGLQLIFVVEANKQCKSDWIYIKDTIERFYEYDKAHVKFSPIYMNGKGNYKKQEKEISSLIAQYRISSKINQSKVIFCFDCDDYDSKQEDAQFLKEAKHYCNEKGFDFVWFCKDVERVYLGKKVDDSKKKKEAATFKEKKLILGVDSKKLMRNNYVMNTSNLMNVIDKYLSRK